MYCHLVSLYGPLHTLQAQYPKSGCHVADTHPYGRPEERFRVSVRAGCHVAGAMSVLPAAG